MWSNGDYAMECLSCLYCKSIDVFSKCAGVPGRCRVGTSYYCSHPKNMDPVPVIPTGATILETCPVIELKNDGNNVASDNIVAINIL